MAANMLVAYYSKGCDSEKMFDGLTIGKSSDFKKHLNKYDVIHIDVQWFLSSCADIKSIISYITQSVFEELKEYYPEVLPNEVLTLADALSRIRNSRRIYLFPERLIQRYRADKIHSACIPHRHSANQKGKNAVGLE